MTTYNPRDPWSTDGRVGYAQPQVARRHRVQKAGFNFSGVLRLLLVVSAMLLAVKYGIDHHYFAGY